MEILDCMSPRTCPSCWHFQAGRCGLQAALNQALELEATAPMQQGILGGMPVLGPPGQASA